MRHVLVVDDDDSFLDSLQVGLSSYSSFDIVTANNGAEAVKVLDSHRIDLVVTDLQMPVMDGFQLITEISQRFAGLPVLAMTAYAPRTGLEQARGLGLMECLEKPIDLNELVVWILKALDRKPEGYLQGISLASIMQLMEMEGKTATLRVASGSSEGAAYFSRGHLIDATCGELRGNASAMEIIRWTEPRIQLENRCYSQERTIESELSFLIMESLRQHDEASRYEPREVVVSQSELIDDLGVSNDEGNDDALGHLELPEEVVMSLEKHLEALRDIKGYKAAAIMNFTGEVLASDSVDSSVDLAMVGATFNDIFRSAHEASNKIGLDACTETAISTPKGLVLMRCSGTHSRVHFHTITVMAADGNQALAKMKVEQAVPKIMNDL